nr:hypothetical protein [Nostoc sp. CreGUA01]
AATHASTAAYLRQLFAATRASTAAYLRQLFAATHASTAAYLWKLWLTAANPITKLHCLIYAPDSRKT